MILDSLLNLRASDTGTSTLGSPAAWLYDALGMVPSESGVMISERNAVSLSAVWTCVNIRAGLMASLPLNVYASLPNGQRRLADNRREYRILHDRPSPEDTSYSFRHRLAVSVLLWGNGYAQIETDGRGGLRYLWPYHPSQVRVVYGSQRGEFHYLVSGQTAEGFVQQKVLPEDMLHLRGFCFEGLEGISVIQNYRRGLGVAVAAEIFESNFYKNGAKMSGVLSYPGRLNPEGRTNLQESFDKKFSGSNNAGKTLLLEEGAKYTPTMMPLTDAEFIASKRMSRAEIAGLFRIPCMLVPGSDDKAPTYASSEIFNRQLVDYTLREDATLWQDEFSSKSFPAGDHFCEFDLKDLLRADHAARGDYLMKRWQMGSISANEIRAEENENPIKGPAGDRYYVQSGYVDANAPPPADSSQSDTVPPPKPGKPGPIVKGFRMLLGNVAGEIQAWNSFNPGRAAAKLRGVLIEPLAAQLDLAIDPEIIVSCSDALAMRVRELKPEQMDAELEHLIYVLQEPRI